MSFGTSGREHLVPNRVTGVIDINDFKHVIWHINTGNSMIMKVPKKLDDRVDFDPFNVDLKYDFLPNIRHTSLLNSKSHEKLFHTVPSFSEKYNNQGPDFDDMSSFFPCVICGSFNI
jgi:hypothetical protein